MSNTSTSNDKTVGDDAKVKLIIGEIGRDTKTGIIGRGYSFDNGNTFHVTDTIFGRLYDDRDADGIWNNGMHEKVKEKVNQEITNTVEPAIKQANSAVAYANDAIEKSRVNSQAIVEINSAVSDAVSDAAVARSDGLRAWNAAQSNADLIDSNYASASAAISSARTEAIAAADEAKASASAAQADIVAVRSDVAVVRADVASNKSDVAVAKSDIAVVKTNLTSQATSLSSYAAQASAVGQDITVLKSQAGQLEQDMADTKGDVSQLKVSASAASAALTDAQGNISSLQASAKSYSAALSDTNSNVATVTATASELETKYADAAGDISQLQTDAKGTTQTLADAKGDIAKLKIRADGFDTEFADTNGNISKLQVDASGTKQTLTNAKSDIAVLQSRADGFDTKYADVAGDINKLQVDASGMKQTLTDAQGNISTLQATATGFKNTLTDAQGNISTLQSDVSGLKKTTSDHAGNIATLQADAKTLTSQMSSAQGDISTLKQTASGFSSKVSGMETSLADTTSKLNNLVTSGRNYIQNSESITMQPNGTDNYDLVWYVYNDAFASNTYCHGNNKTRFSFYLTPSKALNTAKTYRIYWRASPWTSFGTITVPANTTDTQYYELAMTTPTSQPIASQIFMRFMADSTSDISYTITKSMLTIGDSFPDWQPAPEDTNSAIETTKTDLVQQITDAKNAAIKVSKDSITSEVSDVRTTITQVDNKVSGVESKVDSTKQDLQGQINSANTKIDSTNTKIDQTATSINDKVSGVENKVDSANNKIDNLQIGGRNLLTSSKTMHDGWSTEGTSIFSEGDYLAVRATGSNMRLYQNPSEDTNGKLMSVSFDAEVPADSKNQSVQIWVGPFQAGVSVTISGNDFKRYKVESWKWNSANKAFSIQFKNANDKINIKKIKLEFGNKATDWSSAPEDIATDISNVNTKVEQYKTKINQNEKAIALKADQTTVDKTNGAVQQLQAQLKVQSDQISSKVSSSDLDARGYATQTYTQTQIKQASDSWNANLTSVQNDLTDKYTNLHATVDGIKGTVATKADQSEVTQLSNLVQTKVSSGDFTSTTTQLKNLINQRVQVGDVISQINQEAGGDTLIQVSNGKKSLILDAGNTIVTGKAWIPVAAIANLTADDIKTGTLTGSTVHLDDGHGNTIDMGALSTDYVGFHSKATNGDQTYIDLNGIHNYGSSYDTKISQGKITTNLLAVNGGGLIDFRSSGNGTTIDSQNIKFYNSNAVNGGIEFSGGSPLATARDGAVGNELRVRYDRSFALTPITDESARICASSAAMQVGFIQSGSSTPDRQTTGLWVDNDRRHVNLGVWGADSTWARVEANTHNIHMQADKAHAWLSSDNVFHIYKDGDSSSTAIKLQVDGWAWVNGWVEAAGHSQHSALSTKTDIQPVDNDKMLEMINDTDLATFLYKTDVANGETHRHIGLIIDDVHDVAQYQTPQDFIAPNGVSRDDDNMIGALFGAVKALTKRIKTLESKVG